jgi:hypothetical protein
LKYSSSLYLFIAWICAQQYISEADKFVLNIFVIFYLRVGNSKLFFVLIKIKLLKFISCGVLDRTKEKHLSLFPWMVKGKATKGLIALTPEIDCDQTAMGLPPVTPAIFLNAK